MQLSLALHIFFRSVLWKQLRTSSMKTKPHVDTHEVEIIFERLWKLSSASSSAPLSNELCRVNHNKLVQNRCDNKLGWFMHVSWIECRLYSSISKLKLMQSLVNERREFYLRYLQTPWCYPLNKMVSVVITFFSQNNNNKRCR